MNSVQWLALWFCDQQILGSNPVGDYQVYELFIEIALFKRFLTDSDLLVMFV